MNWYCSAERTHKFLIDVEGLMGPTIVVLLGLYGGSYSVAHSKVMMIGWEDDGLTYTLRSIVWG